ncbi:MAG: hypothetical protein AB8B69_11190, partial [Chitinophagales bacterium]
MQNHYFKTVLFLLLFSFNAHAQLNPIPCNTPSNSQELDINNVRAKFWASGSMWFDPVTGRPNYEIPKGEDHHSLFAFDLWMGAIDEFEQKRLDWQAYAGEFVANAYFPGPLNNSGYTDLSTCEHYDRVWKINKSAIDSFRLGLLVEIPKDILEWPAKGNPHISFSPQKDLAPFVDLNKDQIYSPLEGDYPDILGDQALWWVFNDNGHGEYLGFLPLQMEVQVMAYAYNSSPKLQNHTFYKYTFTNRGYGRLDDIMLGLHIDADLGQFDDDYVGCDTLRNLAIAYNGDMQDGDYGEDIPIAGIKLLQGPQKSDDTYSDMYTFWYRGSDFTHWGRPSHKQAACYGLWGLSQNGTMMTYGGHGTGQGTTPTLFMYPSDPTDEDGWSECSENNPPADRTMFMGVGPFSIEPNQQKELHFAALWVRDNIEHTCPSFAPIQEAADYVQDLFDNGLITNIEENPTSIVSKSNVHLFPNPATANTILTLQQEQTLQEGTFQLFDSLGRLVKSVDLKALHQ